MKSAIDNKKLREVAGGFATGISVVTLEKNDGSIIGMTINSFVSISLEPALIGFFINNKANLYNFMKGETEATVSILAQDQKEISNQFAGLNKHEISIEYESVGHFHKIKNALGWYSIRIEKTISLGDHLMICLLYTSDAADE